MTRSCRSRAMRSRSLAMSQGAQVLLGLAHLDQVVDPGPELGLEEGLEQVVVRALAQDVDAGLGVVARREDQDGRRVHAGLGAHRRDQLVAGSSRAS